MVAGRPIVILGGTVSRMLAQATSGDVAIIYVVAIATIIGAAVTAFFLFRRR